MDKFSNIFRQAIEIKSFETNDTDKAWAEFMISMDQSSDDIHKEDNIIVLNDSPIIIRKHNFFRIGLIAASFLVIFALSQINPKEYPTLVFSTTTSADSVVLPDGSFAYLDLNSAINYPSTFNNLAERRIDLKGDGRFEVSKNRFQPFRVYASDIVIEALGTIFWVDHTDQDIDVTNIEGVIKVFLQKEPDKFYILTQGQTINYKNGILMLHLDTLSALQSKLQLEENEKTSLLAVQKKGKTAKSLENKFSTFTVETVVKNNVIKLYKKQIKLAKGVKFLGSTLVKLDITMGPEEILKELKKQGFIDYKAGECEGCFIITKGTK